VVVVLVVVGRAIAWKATDASFDDILFAVIVLFVVPVNLLEERLCLVEGR